MFLAFPHLAPPHSQTALVPEGFMLTFVVQHFCLFPLSASFPCSQISPSLPLLAFPDY